MGIRLEILEELEQAISGGDRWAKSHSMGIRDEVLSMGLHVGDGVCGLYPVLSILCWNRSLQL